MKVLLDECLPLDFRHSLSGHEARTVVWAGLKGLKNGDLLRAAESAGYDVLVTVDQGIPHQQNLTGGRSSVIVLSHERISLKICSLWSTKYSGLSK
jgi:predicted nuclease of predicted toxin-antitoxin system